MNTGTVRHFDQNFKDILTFPEEDPIRNRVRLWMRILKTIQNHGDPDPGHLNM